MQGSGLSIALAAGMAVLFAASIGLSLAALAKPSETDARISVRQQKIRALEQVFQARTSPRLYPADAICRQRPDQAAAQLRTLITGQAQAAKLAVTAVEIGSDPQAPLGETLAPLRIQLTTQGAYDATLSLMATMARYRPMIFVDAVDLSSKTSSVSLKFSGHLYCAAET